MAKGRTKTDLSVAVAKAKKYQFLRIVTPVNVVLIFDVSTHLLWRCCINQNPATKRTIWHDSAKRLLVCWRRPNIDPVCRLNIDPRPVAVFWDSNCG